MCKEDWKWSLHSDKRKILSTFLENWKLLHNLCNVILSVEGIVLYRTRRETDSLTLWQPTLSPDIRDWKTGANSWFWHLSQKNINWTKMKGNPFLAIRSQKYSNQNSSFRTFQVFSGTALRMCKGFMCCCCCCCMSIWSWSSLLSLIWDLSDLQ